MEFILTILLISFLSIPFSDLLFFLADMLLLRLVAPLVGPHACRPAASLFFGDRRRAAKAAGDGDLLPWGVLGGNYLEVDRYDQSASPVVCVFCLSDIEEGEEVRELRCRHLFHRRCLDPWLACRRATCPLCRDPQQQQQQDQEEEDEELEHPAMAWLAYAPSWAW
ncbi:E3 ubiquitin-protein ligase RNF13-like [Zingiber officinale]|uniref:E3 ubiquitin-protein ligase RNF13-like n=1 Tax=Zingiber officinale TaxID=94328 RepID=UPI001C4C566A|nr:E3 ubiquitin-protein ligase RNF13-like [Zingiber officinale]